MRVFLLPVLTVALAYSQSGCATLSPHQPLDSRHRVLSDHGNASQNPVKYRIQSMDELEPLLAEVVIVQSRGYPKVHVSVAEETFPNALPFQQGPFLPVDSVPSISMGKGPVVDRAFPVEAIRWLALEYFIWTAAYRQGSIQHQSVGRGFGTHADDTLAQHAMRQTVQVRLGGIHCSAHRKFYQEAVHSTPREVDGYVAAYRRKHGLPVKAPFGIDVDRVKEQIYLRVEGQNAPGHRLSLHRAYAVLGQDDDSEMVESSLICKGVPVDPEGIGTLILNRIDKSRRVLAQFVPKVPLRVMPSTEVISAVPHRH